MFTLSVCICNPCVLQLPSVALHLSFQFTSVQVFPTRPIILNLPKDDNLSIHVASSVFCLHGFALVKLLEEFQRNLDLALLIIVECVYLKYPRLL